jgi:threonine/homoserine/homoserine lactone efflux protein
MLRRAAADKRPLTPGPGDAEFENVVVLAIVFDQVSARHFFLDHRNKARVPSVARVAALPSDGILGWSEGHSRMALQPSACQIRRVIGQDPLPEKLLPFVLFAFVGSITPGPNNMISTASGAAFGFARTMPQMLGVSIGFPLMMMALGLGLGEIFRQLPWLHEALRYAGAAFLLYLAWRIAGAAGIEEAEAKRPLSFIEAAIFQWLNPKAWTLALGALAAFTTPGLGMAAHVFEIGLLAVLFGVNAFIALVIWCLFGVMIAQALRDERKRKIFQLSLAGLLALSVVFLFV